MLLIHVSAKYPLTFRFHFYIKVYVSTFSYLDLFGDSRVVLSRYQLVKVESCFVEQFRVTRSRILNIRALGWIVFNACTIWQSQLCGFIFILDGSVLILQWHDCDSRYKGGGVLLVFRWVFDSNL